MKTMNTNDITITLTESQHELLNDVLLHAVEAYQVVAPYDSGMDDLPMDNEIIQRYTMLENLREMMIELQKDTLGERMRLRNLFCAGILLMPAFFPNIATANTIAEQHRYLARTIVSIGIPVTMNTKHHCPPGESGSYFPAGFMVICQDHHTGNGKEVQWTANDYDTLRHEAHHLLQDCAAGSIGDRKMSLMFNTKEDLLKFPLNGSGYSQEQLQFKLLIIIKSKV